MKIAQLCVQLLVAAACVMFAVFSSPAQSADKNVSSMVEAESFDKARRARVPQGTYQDLTFLRRMKLTAAYFVNPEVATASAVVYKFEPHQFSDPNSANSLMKLIDSGTVTVAATDGAFVRVIYSDSKLSRDELVKLLEGSPYADAVSKKVFVSTQPELLGKPATSAIVTWDKSGSTLNPNSK